MAVVVLIVTSPSQGSRGEGKDSLPFQHSQLSPELIQIRKLPQPPLLKFIIQMIEVEPERTPSTAKIEQSLNNNPYILRRIFYTLILTALLVLMCFFFQLLDDYDLLSMVLGFMVCIILQFTLLSYCFKEDMRKLKMDEIGVIDYNIKQMFGELDPQYVARKNKQKYYRREISEEDRLFNQSNDRIYQNVMTYLRGKQQPNYTEMISKVKGKWLSLQCKVKIIQDFLQGMTKMEDCKKLIYLKYKNRIRRIHDSQEYADWIQFLGDKDRDDLGQSRFQSFINTSTYQTQPEEKRFEDMPLGSQLVPQLQLSQFVDQRMNSNWGIFNYLLLDKIKLAQKSVSDVKERVFQQFTSFATTIRNSSWQYSKKRQLLLQEYRASLLQKQKTMEGLQKNIEEITVLSNNKIVGGEIQKILERQFKMRLLKIESDNWLIKISKINSNSLSVGQNLFSKLEEENKQLQYFMTVFNRKINQYIHEMAGMGEHKAPNIRKNIKQFLLKQGDNKGSARFSPEMDVQELYNNVLSRRSKQASFKSHLQYLVKQFQELRAECSKSKSMIRQFKYDLEKNKPMDWIKDADNKFNITTGVKQLNFANKVNDPKLTLVFQEIANIEEGHNDRIRLALLKQIDLIRKFQAEAGGVFNLKVKQTYDEYKRREDDLRRYQKRNSKIDNQIQDALSSQYNASRQKLIVLIVQYAQENKIPSILAEVVGVMAQLEQQYSKLAADIDFLQANEENQRNDEQMQRKKQKFTAFSQYIFKRTDRNLIDEQLSAAHYNDILQKVFDENKLKYLIEFDDDKSGTENGEKKRKNRFNDFFKYRAGQAQSLAMINRVLCVLFNQWSKSAFFHDLIKDQILTSLNRKKPDIVEHVTLEFFRIIEREKDLIPIQHLTVHQSQIYRCLLDFYLNFRGKIAVKICTKFKIGNRPDLTVKLMIKEFKVPIRLCFTPYSLGKCYASLLDKPKLTIDYNVKIGGFQMTKIPLFTWFIKTYAVIKLRKKFLWPKRMTLNLPLSFKSPLELAIEQRKNFQKERERLSKKGK